MSVPADRSDVFEPDPHLRLDGIPPIPAALARRLGRYTDFAPVEAIDWHPTRRALLMLHRNGGSAQLHTLDAPMTRLHGLTQHADPIGDAAYEPRDGAWIVHARDNGGDEASQLFRLDVADGRSTLLTDPREKHGDFDFDHAGKTIAFTSLPLDRTASGSQRDAVETAVSTIEPLAPANARVVTTLPGGGWHELCWSPDDRTLYVLEMRSIRERAVWAIDVATGHRTRIAPADGVVASCDELHVARDGRVVYSSDEDGEFRQMMVFDPVTGTRRNLTADTPWDVVSIALQGAGGQDHAELAAAIVNVAGRHVLRVIELDGGTPWPLPTLPAAIRAGSVSRVRFARSGNRDEIAITVRSAASPGDVWTIDLRRGAVEPVVQWTRATVADVDTASWREAETIEWTSFDGLAISALVNRPPPRFAGPRPVLVHIHGGPESQATIGFLGVANYFVDELGMAYIQPNVRGSTGYGSTFVSLDDGAKREDAVRDIGTLLDWIATQPDLDASRVIVAGRSYGGFMSLAVAAAYAHRLVASIAIVAISHFTTFLERTESYRRDLRRVEYGDERDPAMRAFFERISPLSNADRITKPLFVVAGQNDPRVPVQEGEQIVAKVRANGVPVWHLVADNEGHVFTRKPNIDCVSYAQALFVERALDGRVT